MFVVTNRQLHPDRRGFDIFGSRPNELGPNELRVLRVERRGRGWSVDVIPDELDDARLAEIGVPREHDAERRPVPVYGSRYVAHHVLRTANPRRFRCRGRGRNVVVYVHGFNNTVRDVVTRAAEFERTYGVEVVVFSWPANGGGVRGVLDYLDDKRDARASVGALDRTLAKLDGYLHGFNSEFIDGVKRAAQEKCGHNAEARDRYIAEHVHEGCPFTMNLVLHSMGNYLFKQVLKSGAYRGRKLLFDNVVLVAADTNSHDHAAWVDRIRCRKRIFVTINENDTALMASRMKGGEEQLMRLGQSTRNLDSTQALYVDFTQAAHVRQSHAYFEDKPVEKNERVREFFRCAFNGECAEETARFDAATGMYRVR